MERAGTLPLAGVVDLCFDRGLSKNRSCPFSPGRAGSRGTWALTAEGCVDRIIGDEHSCLIFESMVRQTVKWIGAMIALVKGKADAVILTGGMMNSRLLSDAICTHRAHGSGQALSGRIRDGGSC